MNKNTLTWIGVALIVIISGVFGAMIKGYFTPDCPQIKKDTVKIPFDTTDFVAHLKPIIIQNYKDTGSIQWYPNNIYYPVPAKLTPEDTLRILADYFATKFDTATIVNDSLLWFKLNYGITQNRLISADGKYFIKKPSVVVNNNPVITPSRKLYIGAGIGTDILNKVALSGRLTLQNKKDALYGFEITFIPGQKLIYSIHHDIKIKF